MGLDMYLNKMPRYNNTTAEQVNSIENYFDWLKAKSEGSSYANCTLKEWCGIDENELPNIKTINYYSDFYIERYADWDTQHKYGHHRIFEEVGYWRKANAIHNWFVEHVQDGEDDCSYHREVTKEDLEELLETCKTVINSSELADGKIENGSSYDPDTGWVTHYIDGKIVVNPEIAEELLPSRGGFFFGGVEYDEYYIKDISHTIEIIKKVLNETDFEKEAIYYVSSW